ncbi:proline racemase family protein [Gemmatimonadota bacterium]
MFYVIAHAEPQGLRLATDEAMAAMWAKGELPLDRDFRHEGILGTIFTGRLLRETRVGDYPAVAVSLYPYLCNREILDGGSAAVYSGFQDRVTPAEPSPCRLH